MPRWALWAGKTAISGASIAQNAHTAGAASGRVVALLSGEHDARRYDANTGTYSERRLDFLLP